MKRLWLMLQVVSLYLFLAYPAHGYRASNNLIDLAHGITPEISAGSLVGGGPCFRGDKSAWVIKSEDLPASMTIDLGAENKKLIVGFEFGTTWRSDIRHALSDFKLEYSEDGVTWKNIVLPLKFPITTTVVSFSPWSSITWARYIRLTVIAGQPDQPEIYVAGFQAFSYSYGLAARQAPWFVRGNNAGIALSGNIGIGTDAPTQKVEVNGGLRLNASGSKPACAAATRGTFWLSQAAEGAMDFVEVCMRDATGRHAWRKIMHYY